MPVVVEGNDQPQGRSRLGQTGGGRFSGERTLTPIRPYLLLLRPS